MYVLGCAGVLAAFLTTYYVCVRQQALIENYNNYFFPGIVLWSVAVYVFIQRTADKLKKYSGIVGLVSRCSLGIYGIHMLFVFLLWDNGISTFSFPGIISVPVISAAVFAVSLFSVWLLKKIPVIRKVLFL